MHSHRHRPISKIDGGATNDASGLVEDQAKAPALVKECKPIAARVVIDAVLANARNGI